MDELERALICDSAAAPPDHILEGLSDALVHREISGAPRTIYQELWHLTFWQEVSLDWIRGIETPYPAHAADGFPTSTQAASEPWDQLCQRFLRGSQLAAGAVREGETLNQTIRCPSPPGAPVRTMSVRGQLESLAAHNSYHLGRIVLMRQLMQAWPPASGGYSW